MHYSHPNVTIPPLNFKDHILYLNKARRIKNVLDYSKIKRNRFRNFLAVQNTSELQYCIDQAKNHNLKCDFRFENRYEILFFVQF